MVTERPRGYLGGANLPAVDGGRLDVRGDVTWLTMEGGVIRIRGMGGHLREALDRSVLAEDVISVQRAEVWWPGDGVRFDLVNGEVWYFWPGRRPGADSVIRGLLEGHVQLREGAYRLRRTEPSPDDFRGRPL